MDRMLRPRTVLFNNMLTPYTNRLYNALVDAGVDLAVVSCSAQEAVRSWAGTFAPRYPHEILPGVAIKLGPNRYAHVNGRIVRTLDRLKPDLLVINGFYPSMVVGALWAAAHRIPLVLTMDGWRKTMPQSPYHRIVRPAIIKRCHAVVCCGDKGAAFFREAGVPPEALFVVPLVPGWEAPADVAAFSERPFDLLWAAQIENRTKNAMFFADVVIALNRRLPDLRVRVVGRGSDEVQLLARLDSAGIQYRHDRDVPWWQMADVYASAKVLALPSVWEPWGLVCNEALQCGVPCVVSPLVGAANDAVVSGFNGYVCPLDVADWEATLSKLVRDEGLWNRLSANGRSSMRSRTIAQSAERFLAMLDSVPRRLAIDARMTGRSPDLTARI